VTDLWDAPMAATGHFSQRATHQFYLSQKDGKSFVGSFE
jgi:hypothetical protein